MIRYKFDKCWQIVICQKATGKHSMQILTITGKFFPIKVPPKSYLSTGYLLTLLTLRELMTGKELNYLGEKLQIGIVYGYIIVLQLHRESL